MDLLDKHGRSIQDMTTALSKSVGATDDVLGNTSSAAIAAIAALVEHLKVMQKAQDVTIGADINDEPVQQLVVALLDGKTGPRSSADEAQRWHREAEERYKKQIPPGFADSEKSENGHGDYFLWRQLLDEATRRALPVILVSRDQKPDWVRRDGTRILGPQPALIEEMADVAGVRFTTMLPSDFLTEARTALAVEVSESTVSQVREQRVDIVFGEDVEESFAEWVLAHPEILDVRRSAGRTWRRNDLLKLLGPELLAQLGPFRGPGRVLPNSVVQSALEAKMLAARIVRLRAAMPSPEELVDAPGSERELAVRKSKELSRAEAELAALLDMRLPGVQLPVEDDSDE